MKQRVIGIGNALTDMLVKLSNDNVLAEFELAKGSMSLVDSQLQTAISKSVAGSPYSLSLGGSAANTIRAMARMGIETGYIGKVGYDETGEFYTQALRNIGVAPYILHSEHKSGKCVSLVSPDGERTLVTHLGAAADLQAVEIDGAVFDKVGSWFYLDDSFHDVRFIVLDCQDRDGDAEKWTTVTNSGGYADRSYEQLHWLANVALKTNKKILTK